MVYFISDIHLGLLNRDKDRIREDILINFLEILKKDCKVLYILGDLFDYWFEYKLVVPKYFYRVLSKLKELTDSGVLVEYLMGNHDFGHLDFFSKELGINVQRSDIEVRINDKLFYLSHGDGKEPKDYGYLFLKKILRNGLANQLYRFIHPDIGIRLARTSSRTSRGYSDKKLSFETDGLEEFAKSKIELGFDYVVMGHRHRLINKPIATGYYINLGDWINGEPHYGFFDGKEFKLIPVKEILL